MSKTNYRFYSLLVCLLPFSAKANFQNGWYDNWLFGISAGYATRNALIQSAIDGPVDSTALARESSDNGWLSAAFIGYQSIHQEWLLGVEFNLEWQNIDNFHDYAFAGRRVSTEYRRKGMLDLSGRVGYALTPNFMPYLRVGAEISRDSLSSDYTGRVAPMSQLFNKAWIHRFLLGAGVEAPIPGTCGITARLEYDYHSKGQTIQAFGATGEGSDFIEYYSGMQPRTYSGRLSVVWNFFL